MDLLVFPKQSRMPNLLIVGETNNGKTVLVNRFRDKHPPLDNPNGDAIILPVLYIQALLIQMSEVYIMLF